MINSGSITVSNCLKGCQKGLAMAAYGVTHSEPLEKIAKITNRCIEISGAIHGTISKPFATLGTQLRDAITIFETIKIVDCMQLLLSRDESGRYFLANTKLSWQRRLDRLCLTVHSSFKTVKGLNKMGFVSLGVMTKNAIGQLPIFNLTMDSFVVLSSIFGAWESISLGLPKANSKVAAAEQKVEKWQFRPLAIDLLKVNDEATLRLFKEKYTGKIRVIDSTVASKQLQLSQMGETDAADKLAAEVQKLADKREQLSGRLTMIESSDGSGLAADLATQNITGKGGKIDKWKIVVKNEQIPRNKHWLRIANSIAKIAIVALALFFTAMYGAAWSMPIILTVLIVGNVVDSIGLTKVMYDEFAKPKPLPIL